MLCLQLINRYSSWLGGSRSTQCLHRVGRRNYRWSGRTYSYSRNFTSWAYYRWTCCELFFSDEVSTGQYFLIGKKQQLDYHSKLMARSRRLSTWCIARCFSCCFNLLATDSGSNPCDSNDSEYSERTSFNSSSTSLTKSILKSISSASKVGLRGPWC